MAARSDDLKLRIIKKFGAKSLDDIKAEHKAQLLQKPNIDLQEMCGHLQISKKGLIVILVLIVILKNCNRVRIRVYTAHTILKRLTGLGIKSA